MNPPLCCGVTVANLDLAVKGSELLETHDSWPGISGISHGLSLFCFVFVKLVLWSNTKVGV